MTAIEIIQIVLFFGLGIALTPPVGRFMAKVYKGERTFLHPVFLPVEKLIYRLTGIDPSEEMTWLRYFWVVLLFATVGFVSLMGIFMTQAWLPLNPQKLPNCSWHLAFMQAWSFSCNADWQSYAGEATMSYFSQVFGIMVHQFLSGASGLAVLVAVGRALKRATVKSVGSFWVDITRGLLYFVIPLWSSGLKRSLMPPLTTSLSRMMPSTLARSATRSGVAPRREISSTLSSTLCSHSSSKGPTTSGRGHRLVRTAPARPAWWLRAAATWVPPAGRCKPTS